VKTILFMNVTDIKNKAIDLALDVLGMESRPPRNTADFAVNAAPMDGPAGANARAIEASTPPSARRPSPMDNVRIVKPKPGELDNVPYPGPALVACYNDRLIGLAYYDGPPPEVIAGLKALIPPYKRTLAAQNECCKSPVLAHDAHHREMAERIANGGPPHEGDSWTLDDWREDFRSRLSALKQKQKEIEQQAGALYGTEAERKQQAILFMIQELQEHELEHAATFGFNCLPPWIASMKKWATTFGPMSASPETLLQLL
jgi:hypothetical protein